MTARDVTADLTPEQQQRYEAAMRASGFPECPDCAEEVQPGDGDPDGRCWYCMNGEERDPDE